MDFIEYLLFGRFKGFPCAGVVHQFTLQLSPADRVKICRERVPRWLIFPSNVALVNMFGWCMRA